MKKIISMILLGATTALMAGYSEHAYLYKDPRIMGMGGANVAVGGYSTSIFHNPAGLVGIKKSNGLEVELLGLGVSASKDIKDFVDDIDTAADTDDTDEVVNVLKKYSGDYFHADVTNYSSVSMNSEYMAWSVGLLAGADVNFISHGNGGVDGLLETNSRAYGGLLVGAAKSFKFEDVVPGEFDIGASLKYISQKSYEGALSASEIVDNKDDLGEYLQDNYEKSSSAVGFDIGVIYKPFPDNQWHPAFGLSMLNIGGLDMSDNYGSQPMTVNIGASVSPEVPQLEHLILTVDYVDLLNENEGHFYNFDGSGNTTSIKKFEDADFVKRLRLGANLGLADNGWIMAALNVGIYQGNYTAGFDLQMTFIKLNIATYEEEIGLEAGQLSDRRYMVGLGIGW